MNELNKQYFHTKENHKKSFKKWGWFIWIGLFLLFLIYIYHELNNQANNALKIEVSEMGRQNLNISLNENDSLNGNKLPWTKMATKFALKAIELSINNINSPDTTFDKNFPASPGPYNVPFSLKKSCAFVIVGYSYSPNNPDLYVINFIAKDSFKTGHRITVEINIKTNKVNRVYMQPDA